MKKWRIPVAVLGFCVLSVLPALAQWSDNFDSYVSGTQAVGQGGWQAWDNSATAGTSSLLVTNGFSYPNSVMIYGVVGGAYSDVVHKYSGYSSGLWRFSGKQYISGNVTGNSYFILLDKYVDGGPDHWAIQTHFNLGTGTFVEEGSGSSSSMTGSIIRDRWVDIAYDIDLTANSVKFYYNGANVFTKVWQDGTGINQLQAIDLYADNTTLSGPVFYDDLKLALVPEPSIFALGGLAAAALALFRRKTI
jgi:hypothetical protein